MEKEIYDVIIIGGGPAGMTAGIYSARAKMKTLLIEKEFFGGQVLTTYEIKNYPGFLDIDGIELSNKMKEQVDSLGVEQITDEVLDVDLSGTIKKIVTKKHGEILAKSVILCLGAVARKLPCENAKKFTGKGISYCAVCDGMLYKDLTVAVVGGGNTALENAIYLADLCKKVYLIHRRDCFRADQSLVDTMQKYVKEGKIELILNSEIKDVDGDKKINKIVVQNVFDDKKTEFLIDGLFVAIGTMPQTEILDGKVELSKDGYVITDENMQTSVNGVYAAGDVRKAGVKQIVTACADGAIAANNANLFLKNSKV